MATVSLFLMPRSQKYDLTGLWFFITEVLWHKHCLTWHRFIHLQINAHVESPRDLITCNPRIIFLNTLVYLPLRHRGTRCFYSKHLSRSKTGNRTGRLRRNSRTGPANPHCVWSPSSLLIPDLLTQHTKHEDNIHRTCPTHQASSDLCIAIL